MTMSFWKRAGLMWFAFAVLLIYIWACFLFLSWPCLGFLFRFTLLLRLFRFFLNFLFFFLFLLLFFLFFFLFIFVLFLFFLFRLFSILSWLMALGFDHWVFVAWRLFLCDFVRFLFFICFCRCKHLVVTFVKFFMVSSDFPNSLTDFLIHLYNYSSCYW